MVRTPRTSVIDAAKDALSKDPVPAADAAIVSILPANEEEEFVNAVLTTDILAARDALLVFTVLVKLLIDVARDELLVVTVLLMFVIDDLKEEDAAKYEDSNSVISKAIEELNVVMVP